jgi:PAS domain S-box-containing protein
MPLKTPSLSNVFASFRFQLILLVCIVIIPSIGLALFSGWEQRQYDADQAKGMAAHRVRHISLLQDQLIIKTHHLLTTLTETDEVKSKDLNTCSSLFATILKHNPEYANIGLINNDGDIIASGVPFAKNINVRDREYFQKAILTGKPTVGGYHTGRITGKTGINLSYPILDKSGKVIMVVFALLPIETLWKMTHLEDLPPGATQTIIDAGGTVLWRNIEPEKWAGKTLKDKEIIRKVLAHGQGTAEARGIDDNLRLYAFAPLSNLAPVGFVYSGYPLETIYGPADLSLKRNLVLLGGVAILVLLATWMFGSLYIMRKITTLVKTTKSIAAGDITVRTGLKHSGGEIEQLAHAIDQMADSLMEQEARRREAEESILRLHRQNQLILDAAGDGIVGLDLEGKVIFINPAAAAMTGYAVNELLGKGLHQRIHHTKPNGSTYPSSECPMHISIAEGKSSRVRDEVLWRKDGTCFPASYYSTPMVEEGKILGAVVVFRDISERLKAEAEKAKLEAQLYQAQKMEAIGSLAGGIAHDFNNILCGIIGYTEMALEFHDPKPEVKECLQEVKKAGLRAKDLVEQILTFSRKREVEIKPIKLIPIIKETLKLLRATLPANIEIKHHLSGSGSITGDPTQMHQVLMNLCTNAYRAMPNGGLLTVTLKDVELPEKCHLPLPPGQFVKLEVIDIGIGIDPVIRHRIFEPYFTTQEIGRGTGLGLAVVLGIVKNHKGQISVRSEPGRGSTFTICFPKTSKEVIMEKSDRPATFEGSGTILFVDDEKAITDFARVALEMMGYEVFATTNSLEAMEIFQADPGKFDLVITDLTMPKLTGIDLAKYFMQARPDLPVLLATGYTERFDREDIRNLGIRDIILKPAGVRDLGEKIKTVLNPKMPN